MREFVGYEKDRRGMVKHGGKRVQAWHYRIMKSQPMIQWTKVRHGTLNGTAYEFAVTQNGRTHRAYAYFWWGNELLFFQTGTTLMNESEAITYTGATKVAA